MKHLKVIFLLLCSISILSCNSFYNRGHLYVPVKTQDLKYNTNYKSIKELDSIELSAKINPYNVRTRDTVLKRNQLVIDKINSINIKTDSVEKSKNENRLYTLQEIAYGKYVKTYYKRDLRKNYIGYTKKKLSVLEIILYSIGIYIVVSIITAFLAALAFVLILYVFFNALE